MSFKHKHDAVIRAFLDGDVVQGRSTRYSTVVKRDWSTYSLDRDGGGMPNFYHDWEFRIAPKSRWLNVYVGNASVRPHWSESREEADSRQGFVGTTRVAVIEDKQDGSPWVVHKLVD